MRKASVLASGAAAAILASGVAQAGIYAGVGAGLAKLDPELATGINLVDDGKDSAAKAVLGMQLGRRASVELFFSDLGTAELSPNGSLAYQAFGINSLWHLRPAKHGAHRISPFVSLGIGSMDFDAENAIVDRDRAIVAVAGLGAQVRLGRGFDLRATVEAYEKEAILATAVLSKTFGSQHRSNSHKKHARKSLGAGQGMTELAVVSAELAESGATDVASSDAALKVQQLGNVYFNRDSGFLSDETEAVLDKLLATLAQYPQMRLEVQGHTDEQEIGSARALSELRVQRVSNYLWQEGVDARRLSLIAYAASQPASAVAGDALNRRVQFRILSVD